MDSKQFATRLASAHVKSAAMSPILSNGLIGAGIGGVAGLAADQLTRKKEDKSSRWTKPLLAALLGGSVGSIYGLSNRPTLSAPSVPTEKLPKQPYPISKETRLKESPVQAASPAAAAPAATAVNSVPGGGEQVDNSYGLGTAALGGLGGNAVGSVMGGRIGASMGRKPAAKLERDARNEITRRLASRLDDAAVKQRAVADDGIAAKNKIKELKDHESKLNNLYKGRWQPPHHANDVINASNATARHVRDSASSIQAYEDATKQLRRRSRQLDDVSDPLPTRRNMAYDKYVDNVGKATIDKYRQGGKGIGRVAGSAAGLSLPLILNYLFPPNSQ